MWLKGKQANRDNSPAKLKAYTYKPDQPVDLTNNKLSPMRRAGLLQHLNKMVDWSIDFARFFLWAARDFRGAWQSQKYDLERIGPGKSH